MNRVEAALIKPFVRHLSSRSVFFGLVVLLLAIFTLSQTGEGPVKVDTSIGNVPTGIGLPPVVVNRLVPNALISSITPYATLLDQFSQQGPKLVGTGAVGMGQGKSVSFSADGNTALVGGPDDGPDGAAWVWTRSGGIWTQQGVKLVGSGVVGSARQGLSVSLSADGSTALVGGPDDSPVGAAWVWTRSGGIWTQQGAKLVGSGAEGSRSPLQGSSVSLSADGNTAIIGGADDNNGVGAAWVWTRNGSIWTQQGTKLVGSGVVGQARQGLSVSLSADGNTALVGGPDDSPVGAAWVWTRSGGIWTQQGLKLVGSGGGYEQGFSVALSADGNTTIVGGWGDSSSIGAAWIWTRSGEVWTQQGAKLVGSGAVGPALQGYSVSLAADGNTAIVGGILDNNGVGAAWVWKRSGGVWTQQNSKLVGSDSAGNAYQGYSVSLSADGNTAIVGGPNDIPKGAAWIWKQSGGIWTQQGPKLVGSGAVGKARQGYSVSVSADGNTAIVGGDSDTPDGAAWVWTRIGDIWTQQGSKLVGSGAIGKARQGSSVSLSADGNTAIVGGNRDNGLIGAAWVWTRSGDIWTQQGTKLVASDSVGAYQGSSVSLSADGNTAIVGGYRDNSFTGAAWVWTRSGGIWTQQGAKLVGSNSVGSNQGSSVSLSADGNTAIVGGPLDSFSGAAWVWTRSGSIWTQQGAKLVGSGTVGSSPLQGSSVSLSADGNTAFIGGRGDNNGVGAAWVWTRSGGVWEQQGAKLVGAGSVGNASQGWSVSLSADGNTAIVGGALDNNGVGAAWVWTVSGGVWTQQGSKLLGSDAIGNANQGQSVCLSADGNTVIMGGNEDSGGTGAVWVFIPTIGTPTNTPTPTPASTNTSTATPTNTPTATPTATPTCLPVNLTNPTSIVVPDSGPANLYPSTIVASGLDGNVRTIRVKLNNFSHTFPSDIDVLLVGPGGQNALIMSDVGGGTAITDVTLRIDDAADTSLGTPLVNGTFKPTNIGTDDTFPAPAPTPSGGSALSVFNDTAPNGTWSLYVVDAASGDAGSFSDGWELNITTSVCGQTATPTATPTAQPVITGSVTYGNAMSAPTPRFVSNVLVSGVGATLVSTLTAFPGGNYSLSGFGAGSYAVTPTKTGGVNGITSFDAAKIAQHVAGVAVLTGNQFIAADVSGNGTLSSFDAGQVARYVAGMSGFGSTASWVFSPVNRTYPSITTSISGQDYSALLMGEVSGNWTNSGARSNGFNPAVLCWLIDGY